jgi:hypothetical protein
VPEPGVTGPAETSGPAAPGAEPIDPDAARRSFERLSSIFDEMMVTVADISTRRCPYKDKTDHCTAKFGCRNQRRPTEPDGLRVCGGDDRLDYRSAWETT